MIFSTVKRASIRAIHLTTTIYIAQIDNIYKLQDQQDKLDEFRKMTTTISSKLNVREILFSIYLIDKP